MEIKENLLVLWHYIESVFSFDPNSPLLFTQFQFWAFLPLSSPFSRFSATNGCFVTLTCFSSAFCSTTRRADCFRPAPIRDVQRLSYRPAHLPRAGALAKAGFPHPERRHRPVHLVLLQVCLLLRGLGEYRMRHLLPSDQPAGSRGQPVARPTVLQRRPHHPLPVGISFYTFQIISYTADVSIAGW